MRRIGAKRVTPPCGKKTVICYLLHFVETESENAGKLLN